MDVNKWMGRLAAMTLGAVLAGLLVVGCTPSLSRPAAPAVPQSFSITTHMSRDFRAYYGVRHNATGACFFVVDSSNGVAVTVAPAGVCE